MKKFLSLISSSSYTTNYVQFIGSLARDLGAKIYLMSAMARPKELVLSDYSNSPIDHLDEWHDYLSSVKHVHSEIESTPLNKNDLQKLDDVSAKYPILTMPLEVDHARVLVAGLNLSRAQNEIHHPLLVVPYSVTRWKIKQLVHVCDLKSDTYEWLTQLGELADWFSAPLKLYLLQNGVNPTVEQNGRNSALVRFVESRKDHSTVEVETSDCATLQQFEKTHKLEYGDLPVLRVHAKNLLERLFGHDDLKDIISKHANPYLILH